MAITTKQTAMIHAALAAEKLAAAAHVAYWMDCEDRAATGHHIRAMRDEFRKLELAFADLDAEPISAVAVAAR